MAQDPELIEGAEDTDVTETRVYELGFHLDADPGQEEAKKQYQAIRDRISAVGEVVAEGEPTKIPLAYTISRQETTGRRDFDTAFFCWIAYAANGAGHEDILGYIKGLSSIVRFIDIRTDRESAQHAAEMHELFIRNAADAQRGDEDFGEEGAQPVEAAEEVGAESAREAAV